MRSNLSVVNIYKKKSIESKLLATQLLYGDSFKVIKKMWPWIKIKNDTDGYKGFIKKKIFPSDQKNTHKVFNLFAKLYSKPNSKYKIKKKISFGSKIKVVEKKNNFYKFDTYWVKKKDVDPVNITTKEIFREIKNFKGIKYKWGGKSFNGIDCSALVQIFFNFNNKFCPRDTKDQIKYFKRKVNIKNIRKNDLLFWKGHVAVALSKIRLIHAYGPLKKVVIMSIFKTIKRIENTAKLKLIGVRRI